MFKIHHPQHFTFEQLCLHLGTLCLFVSVNRQKNSPTTFSTDHGCDLRNPFRKYTAVLQNKNSQTINKTLLHRVVQTKMNTNLKFSDCNLCHLRCNSLTGVATIYFPSESILTSLTALLQSPSRVQSTKGQSTLSQHHVYILRRNHFLLPPREWE